MDEVRAIAIIEVLGKPKEHVETAIRGYVEKIKKDIKVVKEDFAPAEEKSKLWSTFVELEIITKNIDELIAFCFDYMPSSIDIISPDEFKLKSNVISNLLSDLQGRLHEIDMSVKILKKENDFIKGNFSKILLNFLSVILVTGDKDLKELSQITGVNETELITFLERLMNENKIKKDDNKYQLVIEDAGTA